MTAGWALFWAIVVVGCVAWYFFATIYIGIRGTLDIRSMLAKLRQDNEKNCPEFDEEETSK